LPQDTGLKCPHATQLCASCFKIIALSVICHLGTNIGIKAFRFSSDASEMLYVFVFTAKRMVKGAHTLTSFAIKELLCRIRFEL